MLNLAGYHQTLFPISHWGDSIHLLDNEGHFHPHVFEEDIPFSTLHDIDTLLIYLCIIRCGSDIAEDLLLCECGRVGSKPAIPSVCHSNWTLLGTKHKL